MEECIDVESGVAKWLTVGMYWKARVVPSWQASTKARISTGL